MREAGAPEALAAVFAGNEELAQVELGGGLPIEGVGEIDVSGGEDGGGVFALAEPAGHALVELALGHGVGVALIGDEVGVPGGEEGKVGARGEAVLEAVGGQASSGSGGLRGWGVTSARTRRCRVCGGRG